MRIPALILVVDDNEMNVDILKTRLEAHGYAVISAYDGEQALAAAREQLPDLILLDIMMPKIDGIEVCRQLKADDSLPFMPIIMVTAKADAKDIIAGLNVGADEYLSKPVDQGALVARVKSMLRIKELHDTVQQQAAELVDWNQTLEQKVQQQLAELERMGSLKRFFSPQLVDAILAQGGEQLLTSHRREVSVVFCDLRGFTAFSEAVTADEVMAVLQEYHNAMGQLIFQFGGTLEHFIGDGIMILFNDPLPCDEHQLRAVQMALAMRQQARLLTTDWRQHGYQLGMGIGIACGEATMGQIGFEGRIEYSCIGSVANLASRLCDLAQDGQILISSAIYTMVHHQVKAESLGEHVVKGFQQPVIIRNIIQ